MALRPIIPLLEYVVHYDYIVNELCENREKPQLQCNGKCHLNKELAQTTDDEQKSEVKFQNLLAIPALIPTRPVVSTESIIKITTPDYFHYSEMQSQYITSIDVPPCLLG